MTRTIVAMCGGALMWAFGCTPGDGRAAMPLVVAAPTLEVPPLDAGAAAAAAAGVVFRRPRPAVGARWRVVVSADSVAADQHSEYASTYAVEVLATNGAAATRVRLVVEENEQRYQGAAQRTSIHGKTFLVDGTSVRAEHGTASADEVQRVLDVFPDLGTRTRIDQVLPEAPMAIGDARDEIAGAVLYVVHPRVWTLDKGAAHLTRVEEDRAVFDVALEATSERGLHMRVHGEARVRLSDTRLETLALDGTYDEGTISIRRTLRDLE